MARRHVRPALAAALLAALACGVATVKVVADRRTAAAPDSSPMVVWFGTTHAHTGAFNDHGLDGSGPQEIYAAADAAGFDFLVVSEHSGPTGPPDPAGYDADVRSAATSSTVDGSFVALAGFEYSENPGDDDTDSGHLTVVGTSGSVDATAPGMTFAALDDLLVGEFGAMPVFAVLNHPVATGHPAASRSLLTPERRAVLALSETSSKPDYKKKNEAAYYQAFVRHLDAGWRVAPTCGLDSHGVVELVQPETDAVKPCRTGVLARSLTRGDLLAAVLDRRTYATRDVNLRATYSANGHWMGSVLEPATAVTLSVSASDPDTARRADRITRVEVVGGGGRVVASRTFDSHAVEWRPTVEVRSERYLFVRVYNGERSAHTAVLAPVWLG